MSYIRNLRISVLFCTLTKYKETGKISILFNSVYQKYVEPIYKLLMRYFTFWGTKSSKSGMYFTLIAYVSLAAKFSKKTLDLHLDLIMTSPFLTNVTDIGPELLLSVSEMEPYNQGDSGNYSSQPFSVPQRRPKVGW